MTAAELQLQRRTPAKRKAHQLATALRHERPDYVYLKEVFRQLRAELGSVKDRLETIERIVTDQPSKLAREIEALTHDKPGHA